MPAGVSWLYRAEIVLLKRGAGRPGRDRQFVGQYRRLLLFHRCRLGLHGAAKD